MHYYMRLWKTPSKARKRISADDSRLAHLRLKWVLLVRFRRWQHRLQNTRSARHSSVTGAAAPFRNAMKYLDSPSLSPPPPTDSCVVSIGLRSERCHIVANRTFFRSAKFPTTNVNRIRDKLYYLLIHSHIPSVFSYLFMYFFLFSD